MRGRESHSLPRHNSRSQDSDAKLSLVLSHILQPSVRSLFRTKEVAAVTCILEKFR